MYIMMYSAYTYLKECYINTTTPPPPSGVTAHSRDEYGTLYGGGGGQLLRSQVFGGICLIVNAIVCGCIPMEFTAKFLVDKWLKVAFMSCDDCLAPCRSDF